jgi:hypothetical protein
MRDYSDTDTAFVQTNVIMTGNSQLLLPANPRRIGLILSGSVLANNQVVVSFGSPASVTNGIFVNAGVGPFQMMLSQFGKAIQCEVYALGVLGRNAGVLEIMCMCGMNLDPFKEMPDRPLQAVDRLREVMNEY